MFNINSIFGFCLIAVVIVFIYFQFFSENYQNEIKKIANKRDISKKRYPYQNVSQDSVTQQQKDYAKTYVEPYELLQLHGENVKSKITNQLLPLYTPESKEWIKANPKGAGSLQMKNMLAAGQHIGYNTQGSSRKNANRQIRSEPPNPIAPVSIFLNSSITPDVFRKEFEVGECSL
jgi:hypothetical protein